jgi:hypothetical protein
MLEVKAYIWETLKILIFFLKGNQSGPLHKKNIELWDAPPTY